jgi:hypothetical protein
LISHGAQDTIVGAMEMMVLIARAVALAFRRHQELVLENLALRQQLQALRRTGARPRLGWRDRLFWIVFAKTWRRSRTALALVQPDIGVRWHRDWLRCRWTRRSAQTGVGRPRAAAAIRTLVGHEPVEPLANPYAERLIGSIRRECLDHVIVLGERHLRRILTAYISYYHGARTHLSLAKDAPTTRPIQTPSEGLSCRVPGSRRITSALRAARGLTCSVDGPARPDAQGCARSGGRGRLYVWYSALLPLRGHRRRPGTILAKDTS